MEVGTQYDFVLPSRQSLGVGTIIPRDFIPGYLRSAHGVFQTLLSNNSGPFQHRDAEASEILLSGFSVPLCLYPRTSSLTHGTSSQFYTLRSWRLPDATVAEGDTPSPDDPHRLSPAERATVGGRSCQSPAAGSCADAERPDTKKGVNRLLILL